MPIASRKNLEWDKAKGRGGEWNGGDKTWTGEDVNDHLEKWMKDMGILETDEDLPKSGTLSECVIASGQIDGNMILAKNRDRTYRPYMSLIHYRTKKGIEIVVAYDQNTQYVEGMNEYGIGIVNSTMLNEIDSNAYSGYNADQGKIIFKALNCTTLDESIGIISSNSGRSLEGHTFVADAARSFVVEIKQGNEAHIDQLDPTSGWDARTNHGLKELDAGYMPRDGEIYLASSYRKAMAEVELMRAESPKQVMKIMSQQHNEPASHMNMFRRVPKSEVPHSGFMTTSQLVMDLSARVVYYQNFDSVSDFGDVKNLLPEGYKPKIKIKVSRSDI